MTSLFCASDSVEKNIKEQNNQQSNTLPSHFQNTHTLTLVYFRTSLVVLSSVRENEFVLYLSHYVLGAPWNTGATVSLSSVQLNLSFLEALFTCSEDQTSPGLSQLSVTLPPSSFLRQIHVHVWKSVHSCNTPIPTKKSLGAKSKTQQEVGYFSFSLQILCHFCHFQVSYFNKLLLEINSDQHQIWSV